ncbi:MAG: peptidoglycan editing factor PgeF [Acidibacter sp.]|jgi:YfiH family protein|nr:peptidoglycan editing factor PgeF [Acidibacter sp.]
MVGLIKPEWSAPAGVQSAFSLRSGGTSLPPWHSLNLGVHVGDDLDAVARNRRRLTEALALPSQPWWLEQVHGTEVAIFEQPAPLAETAVTATRPIADAAVTRMAGVVLAIQVADCLPVLLTDDEGLVLGAAHAGWRGLVGGVLERTVEAMGVPGSHLRAWLGPSIGPAHFEVGEEVREAFTAAGDSASAFVPNPRGRWQCDLPALARARLRRLGVTRIAGGEWCTAADPMRFFSHRRDQRTGRMAALLWRC